MTDVSAPLLRMRNVSKRFANGVVALAGLDLEVREHEFVSLLGPSGCGKSTVLRLIAGLARATTGRIEWNGRASGASDIGFVFQEPTLMPWATVSENVALPLRLSGVAHRECRRRADEALEQVGLAEFDGVYPRELSGGMKMRVSIARALVARPRILLLDEPFAALDEITRYKLDNDFLGLWRREAWTVVFVTHSVYESVYMSSRVVVVTGRPGRVAREFPIDIAGARDESTRSSPGYIARCRDVSEGLAAAMAVGK